MRIDPVRRWVSLELPVSKTDSSAVGCSRVWGCICHGAEVAPDCVFHAAAHHCDVMRAALGIIELDPLVNAWLLVLDVSGSIVTKAAVVGTFEHIAEMFEEPLLNPAGVRRFGGHSPRDWSVVTTLGFGVEQFKNFGR